MTSYILQRRRLRTGLDWRLVLLFCFSFWICSDCRIERAERARIVKLSRIMSSQGQVREARRIGLLAAGQTGAAPCGAKVKISRSRMTSSNRPGCCGTGGLTVGAAGRVGRGMGSVGVGRREDTVCADWLEPALDGAELTELADDRRPPPSGSSSVGALLPSETPADEAALLWAGGAVTIMKLALRPGSACQVMPSSLST